MVRGSPAREQRFLPKRQLDRPGKVDIGPGLATHHQRGSASTRKCSKCRMPWDSRADLPVSDQPVEYSEGQWEDPLNKVPVLHLLEQQQFWRLAVEFGLLSV